MPTSEPAKCLEEVNLRFCQMMKFFGEETKGFLLHHGCGSEPVGALEHLPASEPAPSESDVTATSWVKFKHAGYSAGRRARRALRATPLARAAPPSGDRPASGARLDTRVDLLVAARLYLWPVSERRLCAAASPGPTERSIGLRLARSRQDRRTRAARRRDAGLSAVTRRLLVWRSPESPWAATIVLP